MAQAGWPEWIGMNQRFDIVWGRGFDNPQSAGGSARRRAERTRSKDGTRVLREKPQVVGHVTLADIWISARIIVEQHYKGHLGLLPCEMEPIPVKLQIECEVMRHYPAKMQSFEWDQLRILLALRRAGTYAGAARLLEVDDTTVSRRLAALTNVIGAPLFRRDGAGRCIWTEVGEVVAAHAERMESEMLQLAERIGQNPDPVAGTVRLTAVPMLCNRLIAPRLSGLLADCPALILELMPERRNVDLMQREADLALRFARPSGMAGGLWTRRIATLQHRAYGAKPAGLKGPWISYIDELAHLPQARWMRKVMQCVPSERDRLRVADAETAIEAAASGCGIAVLPCLIGDADARLAAIDMPIAPPMREVWIVGHATQRHLGRIRRVAEWLGGLFE
jgi:DNA-binding transcriptional LysR family regulator